MSPLALRIGAGALALLAIIALRGKRWAYLAFVLLGVLSFPAQTHFQVHAPKCEQLLPTMQQLVPLLQNYAYIALFAAFYWISWVQFEGAKMRSVWTLVATLLAAALVEVAEGMTGRGMMGRGYCRVRDLVPDAAGAFGAAVVLAIWARFTRKPGYVRLVRHSSPGAKRPVAAPAAPAAPTAPAAPPRGSRAYAPPPPPLDFSPGPNPATTHAVAPKPAAAAGPDVMRRFQAIPQRLLAMLQRVWAMVLGRRRTIIGSVVVLGLVGAAAFVFLLRMPTAVVEETTAAPPPPSRPLQSDADGYYEPGYQFTVADRRFTRLTLRPEAFVTFARIGARQEAGCPDARIGTDAVHLRCDLDRVGIVTIDGRFTSRFTTSRLDAPVLSAVITVSNTRGETLYRARDSFRWHEPD